MFRGSYRFTLVAVLLSLGIAAAQAAPAKAEKPQKAAKAAKTPSPPTVPVGYRAHRRWGGDATRFRPMPAGA